MKIRLETLSKTFLRWSRRCMKSCPGYSSCQRLGCGWQCAIPSQHKSGQPCSGRWYTCTVRPFKIAQHLSAGGAVEKPDRNDTSTEGKVVDVNIEIRPIIRSQLNREIAADRHVGANKVGSAHLILLRRELCRSTRTITNWSGPFDHCNRGLQSENVTKQRKKGQDNHHFGFATGKKKGSETNR